MPNADTIAQALAQPGVASLAYTDTLNPDWPLTLHTYRPAAYSAQRPVVIVQHGVLRNGDDYRDFWIPAADQHNVLIVAPTFANDLWPGVESYNNGRAFDASGKLRPLEQWTYAIIERVLADLRASGVSRTDKVYLFGHSAGGQFVHRLLSSQSHAPFAAVAIGNPGWYTLPSFDYPYPEGLGGVGLDASHLRRLLAYPLLLLAGDRDIATNEEHLPSSPEALRQGPHRFARAHHYFEAGRNEAHRLGVPFGWTLHPVPGIGHDGRAMSAVCASLWFEGRMPDAAAMAELSGGLQA